MGHQSIHFWLGFDKDPLSALVTLADVMQEFERPTVSYGLNSNADQVTLKYNSVCSGVDLEINDDVLTLRYKMVTDEMRAIMREDLSRIFHEYFDSQYGYLDLSSLGINKVQLHVS